MADDGRGVDDGALLALESVETRRQERVDRGRHPVRLQLAGAPHAVLEEQQAVVDHHRQQLLDEERVALRGLDDVRARVVRDAVVAQEVVDDLRARRGRERRQRQVVELVPTRAEPRARPAAPRRGGAPVRRRRSRRRGRRDRGSAGSAQ